MTWMLNVLQCLFIGFIVKESFNLCNISECFKDLGEFIGALMKEGYVRWFTFRVAFVLWFLLAIIGMLFQDKIRNGALKFLFLYLMY